MKKKKIMVIFGTRPEAIKLAPVIHQLKIHNSKFRVVVCVTGQHREMLDQVLNLFKIITDYDLKIMTDRQDLFDITTKALVNIKKILISEKPDIVLVQGDTTTSFVGSLAAFYLQIPIGHIEAGLRTYNKYSPFPEEKNRHLTSVLADYHFAPTEWAKSNLIQEGIPADRVYVTGNTVIDALKKVVSNIERSATRRKALDKYFKERWSLILPSNTHDFKLILVTGHRRESFGEGFRNICIALRKIVERNPDVVIVYPVHLNPNVQKPVRQILGAKPINLTNRKNIFLTDPLEYEPFVYLMSKSYLILTDSGGIQEEAPSLGKPVLIMRETTERPEAIEAGVTQLVGTSVAKIVRIVTNLLNNPNEYKNLSNRANPFGNGVAAEIIESILAKIMNI